MRVSMYRAAAIIAAIAITESNAISLKALEDASDKPADLSQNEGEFLFTHAYPSAENKDDQKGCPVKNPHGPQNQWCDAHKGYVESFMDRGVSLANQFINAGVGAAKDVAKHIDGFTNCATKTVHPGYPYCHKDCCHKY